ncbi:MAG: hypothetical protein ACHREM_01490 [Polyangiales bacterium]
MPSKRLNPRTWAKAVLKSLDSTLEPASEKAPAVTDEDPNAFIEFAFEAPHHREWQQAFTEDRVARLGLAESGAIQQAIQQACFRLVWEMGRNPEIRIFILCASVDASQNILSIIKSHIEDNQKIRRVFPDLTPGKPWRASSIVIASRASLVSMDHTVQAFGRTSKYNGRADIIVCDNNATSATPKVQTCLVAGGRLWVIEA